MTVYHSIVINVHGVICRSTTDVTRAEEDEYYYRGKGYHTDSFGDINGDVYVVVYEHPKFKEKSGLADRDMEEYAESFKEFEQGEGKK